MSMYEVGTIAGAANQAKVTGTTTKWSNAALGVQQGSILVVYRSGNADLYAIKSVDSDTQLTLSRNITVAFSGASYGIITSETASTSAFANQLASAFSLWRSVVEGWSAALTSTGNITMTDPITGVSVTVPAINGMARIAGGNNLTGTQSLDSDDSGFILGRNSDIGLVKKNGTYGKLMVGKSTRFSLVKSANDRISASDEQTEIFGIESNGDVKVVGGVAVAGDISAKGGISVKGDVAANDGKLLSQALELSYTTPYIDFHYSKSVDDYSMRIICDAKSRLNVYGGEWFVSQGQITAAYAAPASASIGQLITGAPLRSMIRGRGGNTDSQGGFAQLYIEEHVGYEHRAVLMLDGYGQQRAWIWRADGTFETNQMLWLGGRVRGWMSVQSGYLEILVDGSMRGVSFFDSDERKKEDIRDIEPGSAGEIISQLRPVSYKFKDGEQTEGKRYSFGVLAQEVEKIMPDMINTHSDDGKALDPLAAIGLLLAHNKELQGRIENLEAIVLSSKS